MFLVKLLTFFLSYIVSSYILYFITLKLNLKKYINKNTKRKIITLTLCFLIYMLGNNIIDRLAITGNYHTILRALLFSIIPMTICIIDFNSLKQKKVS